MPIAGVVTERVTVPINVLRGAAIQEVSSAVCEIQGAGCLSRAVVTHPRSINGIKISRRVDDVGILIDLIRLAQLMSRTIRHVNEDSRYAECVRINVAKRVRLPRIPVTVVLFGPFHFRHIKTGLPTGR